jgi:hypothetical protein
MASGHVDLARLELRHEEAQVGRPTQFIGLEAAGARRRPERLVDDVL